MNMYEAVLKTARHIYKHPENYNFGVTDIPKDEGGTGCMLGRLAQVCGMLLERRQGSLNTSPADRACPALLGVSHGEFFHEIADIMLRDLHTPPNNNDTVAVSRALVVFAQKHREYLEPREVPAPTPDPEPIPAEVLAIFNQTQFDAIFLSGGGAYALINENPTKTLRYNINTDSMELVT